MLVARGSLTIIHTLHKTTRPSLFFHLPILHQKMEIISDGSVIKISLTLVFLATVTFAWKILKWVWFRPKKVESFLRQQGFSGHQYRFLFGDMKENSVMTKQAKSRSYTLTDSVFPRVIPLIDERVNKYGKNCFTWIGPRARVNIMNPEHIRDVFAKINVYGRIHSVNPLMKMLPSGVFSYEGEKWVKHRKIINPAFHVEKLKFMIPAFYQTCNEMVDKWETLVSAGDGSCELDVWPDLQNLSCDIIARTAFGSSYDEGKKIFDLLKLQCDLVIQAQQSVYIPGKRFLPTKQNKRMKANNREIDDSLKVIVERKEKAMKAGKAAKDDLLGLLMESNFMEMMQNHGNNKNEGMSIKDVIEECKLFYFAGQETTSVLLVWTLVLLSHYKNWQESAREEVARVFGDNIPDFDGLNRLKVVTMILHEVLRLYPPVVDLSRLVKEETKLGDFLLPAGSIVTIPTMLVHQDSELWGDDASEFNPQRFSEGVAKATKNRVIFFPFGGGPRICIGLNFALAEAKMALVTILQRFSFELSPSYVHAPRRVITVQPEHGAQLILRRL